MTTLRQMACGGAAAGTAANESVGPPKPINKWPDTMCFQSDLSSNIALYTLKELLVAGRLKIQSIQRCWLLGVEGTKGKQSFGRSTNTAGAAFARTATHVFRMVMLEACGVPPEHWPTGGESSYRNEDKLNFEQLLGPKFVLANSYEEAREYWSEFDKIYPHFLIEKLLEKGDGNLNRMMFIFRKKMTEVVEITLNVCAQHSSGKNIKSCLSAAVVHRTIDIDGAEGKWLNKLAMITRGADCPLVHHFDKMLDMDTTKISEIQLVETFNSLYTSLPSKLAEIDDTDNCVGIVRPSEKAVSRKSTFQQNQEQQESANRPKTSSAKKVETSDSKGDDERITENKVVKSEVITTTTTEKKSISQANVEQKKEINSDSD